MCIGELLKLARVSKAEIIDQDIGTPPECPKHLIDRRFHPFRRGEVGSDGSRPGAAMRFQRFPILIGDDYGCAFLGQQVRRGLADSISSCGDEGQFAPELIVHDYWVAVIPPSR